MVSIYLPIALCKGWRGKQCVCMAQSTCNNNLMWCSSCSCCSCVVSTLNSFSCTEGVGAFTHANNTGPNNNTDHNSKKSEKTKTIPFPHALIGVKSSLHFSVNLSGNCCDCLALAILGYLPSILDLIPKYSAFR